MVDNRFLGAVAKTLKETHNIREIQDFTNHLLEGKLASKEWLVSKISHMSPEKTLLLGSWYPTYIPYHLSGEFTCVDIDDSVIELSKKFLNNLYGSHDHFDFVVADAKAFVKASIVDYDLVINTSCEHMPYDMKDVIWNKKPLYVFQSNNYKIPEHINYKESLDRFIESTGLKTIEYSGILPTEKYDRYMVIGRL